MLVVGLTGSIAMGKSTIASMLRARGVPVFDADAEVRDLYRGEITAEIEVAFPGVLVDGEVDRNLLSAHVVADQAAMQQLEGIVHPAVARRRAQFMSDARAQGRRIVTLDIPLLFETGGESRVDVVLVVSAPPDLQRARALSRPGAEAERFARLLARQTPDVDKRARAHFVIDTGRALSDSEVQVESFLRALVALEGRHA